MTFTTVSNDKRLQAQYDARVQEERAVLTRDFYNMLRLTKVFAQNYSQSNDSYNYLIGKVPTFAEKNLTEHTLQTFDSDAVWVFKKDGSEVYRRNTKEASEGRIDLMEVMPQLLEKFKISDAVQFSVKTKTGFMAMYGSAVVLPEDTNRSVSSPGFVLTGKFVNDTVLDFMTSDKRNVVRFLPENLENKFPKTFPARSGTLSYEFSQHDIFGKSIGSVYARYQDKSIKILHDSDIKLLALNMSSFLVLLLVLLLAIWVWVIRPIDKIRKGLEQGDSEIIKRMVEGTSEFSKIALLIHTFFEQERSLELDIEEKKRLLTKLAAYNTEIEMTNNVMIGRELRMVELKKEIEALKKQGGVQ